MGGDAGSEANDLVFVAQEEELDEVVEESFICVEGFEIYMYTVDVFDHVVYHGRVVVVECVGGSCCLLFDLGISDMFRFCLSLPTHAEPALECDHENRRCTHQDSFMPVYLLVTEAQRHIRVNRTVVELAGKRVAC